MKIMLDIDGTICEPRQKVSAEIIAELKRLCGKYEIGLITGSHKEYIVEQLGTFIHSNLVLLPCNGTQTWEWCSDNTWNKVHEERISEKTNVQDIVKELERIFESMKPTITQFNGPIGEYIQVRSSLVNFCPIGRNSDLERRKKFEDFDKQTLFRKDWLPELRKAMTNFKCEAVLGGATSFDIYPIGWNKKYGLKQFRTTISINDVPKISEGIIYIGNAFYEDGNDRCMLEASDVLCIEVKNPQETLTILKQLK